MSQTNATKLISKLRYNLQDRRKLKNFDGPKGRHDKIRKTVTALFKHERIELHYNRGDESRGYAERLISDAIRYGECHKETMEMASYWLLEPQLVHKLFKVLVPRYQNCTLSYTKMWRAPRVYPGPPHFPRCVLELRYNIYPPLGPDKNNDKNLIHNILLEAAKKDYQKEKAKKKSEDRNDPIKENVRKESTAADTHVSVGADDTTSAEELKLTNVEGKMETSESNKMSVEVTNSVSVDTNEIKELQAAESKLSELAIDDNSIPDKEASSETDVSKGLKEETIEDDKRNERK